MIIRPEKVSFGALAAERDDGLASYFVASQSFLNLKDGTKTVVMGPRGSGKSAIFRMIKEQEQGRNATVISLSPEDYSYELLQQTLAAQSAGSWAKQGAYAAAWKYLIYILVMKELSKGKLSYKSGPAARVYNYVRDNHSNFDVNPIGVLISYLKRLEGFKLGSYEAGLKARELQKLYRLEELAPLLPDLTSICSKQKAIVLIDELDKGWDGSEDAIAYVAGLFTAASSINRDVPTLRVLVSLRKELYDNIPALYDDAQKIRDLIEMIEWDEPQLLELIAKRIARTSSELTAMLPKDNADYEAKNASYTAIWNMFFSETLDYRKNKSFNYLIDRTLYRPREIIQLCTDVRNKAIETTAASPINYDVISAAEHTYSEARLKDISAEYRFQYPEILNVLETFRGKPYNLTRDELEAHCLSLICEEIPLSQKCRTWCSALDPDDLIEVLWRVGFLRAQAVGGLRGMRRSGSAYLGSHQISGLNLRGISRFHVHPMFRSFLALKEKKSAADEE